MDIFAMLQTAIIEDQTNGDLVGQAVGFNVINGRLKIFAVLFDEEYDDDDDGAKDDIPEDDASNKITNLSVVSNEKNGTSGG